MFFFVIPGRTYLYACDIITGELAFDGSTGMGMSSKFKSAEACFTDDVDEDGVTANEFVYQELKRREPELMNFTFDDVHWNWVGSIIGTDNYLSYSIDLGLFDDVTNDKCFQWGINK